MEKKSRKSTPDPLLTELERQQKYLDQLPERFEFPLFNTRYAIESQRQSGYKHTAAAAREIVDNAIEAGATKVHVIFDRPRRQKGEKDTVSAVAFIDDGAGMLPQMARFALTWGGGTHFDDPSFIGRFGFGLPNASINQTRLVEVYTRTSADAPFTKAVLDITRPAEHALHTIPEATTAELPEFVQRYLAEAKEPVTHGTIVVWQKPDRLRYRRPANLKEHLVEDFGAVYRYLLKPTSEGRAKDVSAAGRPGVEIWVEGTKVEPVDPLFLMPGCLYYVPEEEGGASKQVDRPIPVRYIEDEDGSRHLQRVNSPEDLTHPRLIASGALEAKVARFPIEFLSTAKEKEPIAYKRFQIRKPRRGMSFVRAGREIDTFDVFPKMPKDEANNLGSWPLLQSYAYYWGVEVHFSPSLDEPLGIGNDKQTVRPSEDFWRILAQEEIDKELHKANRWQAEQREKTPPPTPDPRTPTQGELAMTFAQSALRERVRVPPHATNAAADNLEQAAKTLAGAEASDEQVKKALEALKEDEKRRKFHVELFDDPNGPFYTPAWQGETVVARINRKHIFFEVLYGNLMTLPGGHQAKQALDVLLLVLAKAELRVEDEDLRGFFGTQRERVWSAEIQPAYKYLKSRLAKAEHEDEVQEDAA